MEITMSGAIGVTTSAAVASGPVTDAGPWGPVVRRRADLDAPMTGAVCLQAANPTGAFPRTTVVQGGVSALAWSPPV